VTLGLALAAQPVEPMIHNSPRFPCTPPASWQAPWLAAAAVEVALPVSLGGDLGGGHDCLCGQEGHSLGQWRAEVVNVLLGAQVAYFINCR